MIFLASDGCFWPLTASMTSEVKKNHAHVYPYRKLSTSYFSIGSTVWPWIAVWVCQDILRLLIRFMLTPSINSLPNYVTYNPKKPSHQYLTGIFGGFETRSRVQQDSEFRKSLGTNLQYRQEKLNTERPPKLPYSAVKGHLQGGTRNGAERPPRRRHSEFSTVTLDLWNDAE